MPRFFGPARRSGARIVSGYLSDPDESLLVSAGLGSTHAWVEIYVPGAGWIAFDPTNRSFGSKNLIPVAAGRDIHRVSPVSGSFSGGSNAIVDLSVHVSVRSSTRQITLPMEDGGDLGVISISCWASCAACIHVSMV
ncbi:transglutaminase family protein [Boseongicola sp. H5]|uniref:transglutaminase-like domain-containing protein n=1 Tax=Boseongicola sp. H5 TaxID=2763261 RepID=UPI001D0B4EAF|nr:transglutaminase family protein [Boseongicola sp. H5]